ncbi:MAG: DUF4395 domain-containing protein [Chitinophagaceae bacterium]|nr:DUF4395 domain-containing protein [Chitinophagaceae bacterium]MCW5914514.1 DUF4395 domain-containing protein [Chitinophagaceae bacterium]MCZ2395384.1 DUF4395 domain-containing protein [Chitinophagales bacterium]
MNPKTISKNYLDAHVIRLVALQVIIITTFTLYSKNLYSAIFLTLDFAIRAFTTIPSPLAFIAKILTRKARIKPKWVFPPPKKFAAALGFTFSLLITLMLTRDYVVVSYIIGSILIFCALLESVFNICIGCYAYNWIVAPILNRRNAATVKPKKKSIQQAETIV